MTIRPGHPADWKLLLALFDEAVLWLAARGLSGQWGEEAWSNDLVKVAAVKEMAKADGLWVCEMGHNPVGALIVQTTPTAYVAPSPVRELYVGLLLVSRQHVGEGVGSFLLEHARDLGKRRGVAQLRVDCWAGGSGQLVRYYQSQGFTPDEIVSVDGWPAQVLSQPL
jgi:GNAT superfamily N-acetyltransferase